jgi:hypothetical protein
MFTAAECADASELQRICRKFNSEKQGDHGGQAKYFTCRIVSA